MRFLLLGITTLLVVVGTTAVVGYFLPVAHTVSRDAVVAAPVVEVFSTIHDVERYPEWWSDISRVELLPGESGLRFRQHTTMGSMVMEVAESSSPVRFVTRIADPDQPFGGTWTFDLAPDGSGTRVTITERGEVYNVVFRFLSRFVFGHTRTLDSCLSALARKHSTAVGLPQ